MPTRLQLARKERFSILDVHPSRVLRRRDIEAILTKHRGMAARAEHENAQLIEYLTKSGKLKQLSFSFPHRKETRYTWGPVPLQTVLLTIKPDCHFSHYTAVQMHQLTEQDPKTIYLNYEQPPKAVPPGGLEQGRIAAAFARKPRVTANVTQFGGLRICLLNGKNTGYLGVESREVQTEGGAVVARLTDIERTLIDITVRPFYAGGVAEVLKAYERTVLALPSIALRRYSSSSVMFTPTTRPWATTWSVLVPFPGQRSTCSTASLSMNSTSI